MGFPKNEVRFLRSGTKTFQVTPYGGIVDATDLKSVGDNTP